MGRPACPRTVFFMTETASLSSGKQECLPIQSERSMIVAFLPTKNSVATSRGSDRSSSFGAGEHSFYFFYHSFDVFLAI